jgi:hypothetical protein
MCRFRHQPETWPFAECVDTLPSLCLLTRGSPGLAFDRWNDRSSLHFLGLPEVHKRQDKELLLYASANRDNGAVGTQQPGSYFQELGSREEIQVPHPTPERPHPMPEVTEACLAIVLGPRVPITIPV